MKKTAIYLSILLLVLMGCKNDATIIQNMRPLEKYYKKYTVQQLVDKIMQDKKAKSMGIHFDLSHVTSKEQGTCLFRASLIFNLGEEGGYGTLWDRCKEADEQKTTIQYTKHGEIVVASKIAPYYFQNISFLFEKLDLKLEDYKVIETKYDTQRGEERGYFELPTDFQKDLFQKNFPKLTQNYRGDRLLIMQLNGFVIQIRFENEGEKFHYYETLSWETEASDEPRLNFEKEAGQKNG